MIRIYNSLLLKLGFPVLKLFQGVETYLMGHNIYCPGYFLKITVNKSNLLCWKPNLTTNVYRLYTGGTPINMLFFGHIGHKM